MIELVQELIILPSVIELSALVQHYRGLAVTKPVFRVSNKARLKPVSLATETHIYIEL